MIWALTESDSSSVDVDLLEIDTELLDGVDGLGSESLVDLPEVDVLDGEAGELEDCRWWGWVSG